LIIYYYEGLPVLKFSRLTNKFHFSGIIGRFTDFASIYITIYAFYIHKKRKILFYSILLIIIITSVLSGSKGAILSLIYNYFFYSYFYENKAVKINKKILYLSPLLILAAMMVILFRSNVNIVVAFSSLLFRVVASGDIYWVAFGGDAQYIDNVIINHKFLFPFIGLLSPLHILPASFIDDYIGLQLFHLMNPKLKDIIMGPNTAVPVMGMVLYGWGGIILCFFIGVYCSFMIFKIQKLVPKSIIMTVFFSYLYQAGVQSITDISSGFYTIINIIPNIAILYFILLFLNHRIKYKRISSRQEYI
jgi:hypothetical protein